MQKILILFACIKKKSYLCGVNQNSAFTRTHISSADARHAGAHCASKANKKMNKQLSIEQFTKNLFWDISPLAFDVEQCPAQIVERVLERGEWSDWCLIRDYFGLEQLAAICKTLRTMSPESLSYICCITNTRKEDYRCYHFAQSHQTLWNS